MIQFVEKKAKTVEQAIEEALAELKATADEAVIEVIDEGETGGLLGFGRRPAHVKVSVEREDRHLGFGDLEERISQEEAEAVEPLSPKPSAQKQETTSKDSGRKRSEAKSKSKSRSRKNKDRSERKDNPDFSAQDAPSEKSETKPERELKPLTAEEKETIENQTVDFLAKILSSLKIHGTMASYYDDEDVLHIEVEGEDLGRAIGRGGETLEAIQYISSLAANHGREDYVRLHLDIGKYREKNTRILRQRAERAAEKVLATGRYYQMPPMPASDRRFVHMVVSGIDGVESSSQGSEPRRRVVIRKA